ncbi:MAG: hypothetical protein WCH10_06240 [bacterium]
MSAIEQQITEIQVGLSEYKSNINLVGIFRLLFASATPTSKELKEEHRLINWLMQYDSLTLAYVLNNLNYDSKKLGKSMVSSIGILPLLIATIFTALFVYCNYSLFATYKLAILSCSFVAMLIMITAELFNCILVGKNKKCIYLVEVAIKLKEGNISKNEVQSLFSSAENIMSVFRANNVKDPLRLVKKAIEEKNKA